MRIKLCIKIMNLNNLYETGIIDRIICAESIGDKKIVIELIIPNCTQFLLCIKKYY